MNINSPKRAALFAGVLIVTMIAIAGIAGLVASNKEAESSLEFNTFASCSEVVERLNFSIREDYPYPVDFFGEDSSIDDIGSNLNFAPRALTDSAEESSTTQGSGGLDGDFSTTNVQVAGVDEADIIKTDGDYIYVISGKKLLVLDALKPSLEKFIFEETLSFSPRGMFIHGNRLSLFGSNSRYYSIAESYSDFGISPYRSETLIQVFDMSDRSDINLEHTFQLDGNYNTARLIDGTVYLVTNYYPGIYQRIDTERLEVIYPRIASVSGKKAVEDSDYKLANNCEDTSYYGTQGNSFVEVLSFDMANPSAHKVKSLVGGANTIYMSANNLYLTVAESEIIEPEDPPTCSIFNRMMGLCSRSGTSISVPRFGGKTNTNIFRMELDGRDLNFAAAGTVEGTLLNQFSLDEHSGFLRVATTSTEEGRSRVTQNNIHVFDASLNEVGSVEDLAEGERIFSVRFLGDRAYMVTFRQVDPLFVIDLSQPTDPRVLGELKIPGFSDYLHPYDEDHIIGFGKDADPESGRAAGVKIALFDVSDPSDPKEISKVILGGRGSSSELLRDHKALLFDRERDLLVLPVSLNKVVDENPFRYGEREFVGFIAFGLNTIEGFTEKARVSMVPEGVEKNNYYYSGSARSLFVGDNLFLTDSRQLKAVGLKNFKEKGEILLSELGDYYYGDVIF